MTITNIMSFIRWLCDSDSTSYTDAQILLPLNAAYEEIVGAIITSDGMWQFDDTNYTDFPIGKATLVVSQRDYTFDVSHLMVEKVAIKDQSGNYYYLNPIEFRDHSVPLEEEYETDGAPEYYDVDGASIKIYPAAAAANVTTAEGIKVWFRRTADIFTAAQVTTGTKVPGFASLFHEFLCYKAAIPYCMRFHKDRVALYEKRAMEIKEACLKFYSKRLKEVRDRITIKQVSFR